MQDEEKKFPASDTGGAPAPAGEPRRADAAAQRKRQQEAQAEMRRERAAAKLRENLQRRKQQVRARRAGDADEAIGLPAAKMDESS